MVRLSALALLAASAVVAAPVPKGEKKEELYFPVVEGAKRVMQRKDGKGSDTTETVTKVEVKDGVYKVTAERKGVGPGGMGSATVVREVSGKGVYVVDADKEGYPLIKLPAKEGDKWEVKQGGRTWTYMAGKEEEVEVPAGKFKALRVESEADASRKPALKDTHWYTPGVGYVKSVISINGRETTFELKSFTPGKDEPKKDK